MNMTVCIVMAAIRRGLSPARNLPASQAASMSSVSNATSGACAILTSVGCVTSNRGAKSVNSGRLAVGSGRDASYNSSTATFSRSSGSDVVFGGGADLVGRPAQRVFEQCEQQLVFAVELQVEAPQRLAGAVHDLLDGEVGGALFDDDGLRCVEEALNALGRTQFRGLDGPLDGALLPGRLFAWRWSQTARTIVARGEHDWTLPENAVTSVCSTPSRTMCRRL